MAINIKVNPVLNSRYLSFHSASIDTISQTQSTNNPQILVPKVDYTVAMKRILIIGSSGSGKSTLARQLGDILNLPVIHLDKYFWKPDWVRTPYSEWSHMVEDFVAKDKWILDGNYRNTLDVRLKAADTIIFLDLPPWICTWRAMKRRIMYYNESRPDMAKGCKEKIFDPHFPKFMKWIWNYPKRAKPQIFFQLNRLPKEKQVIWLRSPKEVKLFLINPTFYKSQALPQV